MENDGAEWAKLTGINYLLENVKVRKSVNYDYILRF